MISRKFLFITFAILVSFSLFQKEEKFQESISVVTLPIKEWYLGITNSIDNSIDKYLFQSTSIQRLKKENLLLRKYLYDQKITINKLEQYSRSKVEKYDTNKNILQVQTISYKKINDFSKVYLTNSDELNKDKIYGLIQKNVAAGIAIKNDNSLEGILLSNEKCQFSTFIGENNIPGIANGIDERSMEINFIPKWSKIVIGDKVVTSGLDNIFIADVPVGIVSKILTRSTYKTAIIKTHANILRPDYFYLVKKVPVKIKDINKTILELDDNKTKIDLIK